MSAATVAAATWIGDPGCVAIEATDGRFYVATRAAYAVAREGADPGAVLVPVSAVEVPFDPFAAWDAVRPPDAWECPRCGALAGEMDHAPETCEVTG